MSFSRFLAAALLSVAACAETPVAGKWNCTNAPAAGPEREWTLLLREDNAKLTGVLTDGQVEVPLSQVKFDAPALGFRFYINAKPYTFDGRIDGGKLEGEYKGEEATGKLRCAKSPA